MISDFSFLLHCVRFIALLKTIFRFDKFVYTVPVSESYHTFVNIWKNLAKVF